MKDYVIIVAGGKGLRMGGEIPKQFLPIGGRPILMRTLERFREYSADLQIILVLPKAQQDYWQELCKEYHFKVEYQLANGGETRFHSVQNGLALVPDDAQGVVGVHDGVRPFPSIDVIRNCYETAREKKAVIPVIPVVETLRHIKHQTSNTVPRDEYRLVQTPQTFDIQLLKRRQRGRSLWFRHHPRRRQSREHQDNHPLRHDCCRGALEKGKAHSPVVFANYD